jgi:hypothetical protein
MENLRGLAAARDGKQGEVSLLEKLTSLVLHQLLSTDLNHFPAAGASGQGDNHSKAPLQAGQPRSAFILPSPPHQAAHSPSIPALERRFARKPRQTEKPAPAGELTAPASASAAADCPLSPMTMGPPPAACLPQPLLFASPPDCTPGQGPLYSTPTASQLLNALQAGCLQLPSLLTTPTSGIIGLTPQTAPILAALPGWLASQASAGQQGQASPWQAFGIEQLVQMCADVMPDSASLPFPSSLAWQPASCRKARPALAAAMARGSTQQARSASKSIYQAHSLSSPASSRSRTAQSLVLAWPPSRCSRLPLNHHWQARRGQRTTPAACLWWCAGCLSWL